MHELKLNEARIPDLALISRLAASIWETHYTPIIGEAQVSYMLQKMYSQQSLLDQVNQQKHTFYLIGRHDQTIGFLSICEEKKGDWFLNKFYILPEHSGSGEGTRVFETLVHLIHPKKITLTVNRQNYKSINFYFKNKFKIQRVADFDIGSGYVMNDFVMIWESSADKT